MNITDKQKKTIWIIASALVILYFAPSVIMWVRRAAFAQQRAAMQQAARLRAAQQASQQKAPTVANTAPDPNAIAGKLIGVWEGSAVLPPARGFCTERFEVRQAEAGASFTGTSTVNCAPSLTMMTDPKSAPSVTQAAMIGRGLDPVGAKLTGEAKGDSIQFRVDKAYGVETSVGQCSPTSFTLSTFGTGTAGLDFEDSCGKHQILLHRTGK